MRQNELFTLYAYNRWANQRILHAAAGLSDAQFCTPQLAELGSVRQILVHVYGAEWIWRKRCEEGVSPAALPPEEDFVDFDALHTRWQAEEEAMHAFVAGLTDARIEGEMSYRTTSGRDMAAPLWQVLLHVVNHGTQHRAEAAVLLTALGRSPGDIDLIVYVREKQAEQRA